jgi:DNA-binding transcriptional MerR regulator
VKALRLYEQRGLIAPVRSRAGWRIYGPEIMDRAAEIVGLRALGIGLADIAGMLTNDPKGVQGALASHQATLEGHIRALGQRMAKVRELRGDLVRGDGRIANRPAPTPEITFALPWPWGGERFELTDVRPLNYITGPLGSGKTRLAMHIAEALPGAAFVGLERLADHGASAQARLEADPALQMRVDRAMARLAETDGVHSAALVALLVALEADGPTMWSSICWKQAWTSRPSER